jgi:NitT/TauT family transport system substrate-binding protein
MKKIISLLLLLTLSVLTLFSCSNEEPVDEATSIRVGYMSGPTGMGMAKLINDNGGKNGNDTYSFKQYDNTSLAKADLLVGNIDVICLPTNEAAVYFNTEDDECRVLAINTLNTLFLVTDANTTISSFAELEGKTIYTCANGTPKPIIEYLLKKANVKATVSTSVDNKTISTPKDLGAQIAAGKVDIAIAPEPIVTSSLIQNSSYSIDLDIGDEWIKHNSYSIAMGCIVANKNFVAKNKNLIKKFLDEYESSIDFISDSKNINESAKFIKESGIMAAEPPAKKALMNLGDSITFIDGASMKSTLEAFYNAIGVNLPDKEFYYE